MQSTFELSYRSLAPSPQYVFRCLGLIPGPDTVFQDGDQVHVVAAHDDLGRIEKAYDQPPPPH